jgi:hypothetical protein
MVVTAGDSLLYDDGFADDASEAMPELEPAPMPTDGDIAALPDTVFEDGEATPEPEPFSVDALPLTPEQLTAFREHLVAELSPQFESQFSEKEQQWDQVRQSLEGKVNAFDRERLRASAWYSASQDVIAQLLEEGGADQTTQDAIKFRVQQLANQRLQNHAKKLAFDQVQTQQVQSVETEMQTLFQSEADRVRALMHAHAASVGLDPKNDTINQEFDELVLSAAEAFFENPNSPKLQKAFEAAKALHKKRVNELGQQVTQRKQAKPSSDAVKRQHNRGPQNLSRGAGGASPMGLKDHIAALQRQHPNMDYDELHPAAYANWMASRSPQ